MRFLNKLKEEVMAKAKKSDVIVPEAPDDAAIAEGLVAAINAPVSEETKAYAKAIGLTVSCVTCGTAVAPGEVCAVDGQKAE